MSGYNMANREVCNLIWLDYTTKKPAHYMDYANTTTTNFEGETVYAYGGMGHPKRVAFDGDKGGTVEIETQMQNYELFQILTGGDATKTAKYYVREKATTSAEGAITLSATPVEGTAVAFLADDDCGTALETTGSGTTLTAANAKDKDVVVYYMKQVDGVKAISVKSTSFPHDYIVYGDTIDKGEDGKFYTFRQTFYHLHPQTNFSIGFANNGDPASITLTCDILADKDNNFVDMVIEDPID